MEYPPGGKGGPGVLPRKVFEKYKPKKRVFKLPEAHFSSSGNEETFQFSKGAVYYKNITQYIIKNSHTSNKHKIKYCCSDFVLKLSATNCCRRRRRCSVNHGRAKAKFEYKSKPQFLNNRCSQHTIINRIIDMFNIYLNVSLNILIVLLKITKQDRISGKLSDPYQNTG